MVGLLSALCAAPISQTAAFVVGFNQLLPQTGVARFVLDSQTCSQRGMPLALGMKIEGKVSADIQRNFGDKFFLKAEYTIQGLEKPRVWTFRRTWTDFNKLDKWIRSDLVGGETACVRDLFSKRAGDYGWVRWDKVACEQGLEWSADEGLISDPQCILPRSGPPDCSPVLFPRCLVLPCCTSTSPCLLSGASGI